MIKNASYNISIPYNPVKSSCFFSFSVSGRVLCEKNQRRETEEVKKTLVKATPNIS